MTKEEIIELGIKAGFDIKPSRYGLGYVFGIIANLERFTELVIDKKLEGMIMMTHADYKYVCDKTQAVEREECAKIADEYAEGLERNYSELIADKIRARKLK